MCPYSRNQKENLQLLLFRVHGIREQDWKIYEDNACSITTITFRLGFSSGGVSLSKRLLVHNIVAESA